MRADSQTSFEEQRECISLGQIFRDVLVGVTALLLACSPALGVPHMHLSTAPDSSAATVAHAHAGAPAHHHDTPDTENPRQPSGQVVIWSAVADGLVPASVAHTLPSESRVGSSRVFVPSVDPVDGSFRGPPGRLFTPGEVPPLREAEPPLVPVSRRGPPAPSV